MKITANSFVPTEAKIIIEGKSYTGNEFNKLVQALRPLSLNDNQQTVLEWLKANYEQDNASPMCSIFLLGGLWESRKFNIKEDIRIDDAYCELSYKQQAQVLQTFANWALEQEDDK